MVKQIGSFKDGAEFIYNQVAGVNRVKLSDEEYEKIDLKYYDYLMNTDMNLIYPKVKKILGLNILHSDVDFSIFDKMPKTWGIYCNLGISVVSSERNASKSR
jgi:hypothetical protein